MRCCLPITCVFVALLVLVGPAQAQDEVAFELPVLISTPELVYPEDALVWGNEVTLAAHLDIDEAGTIVRVEVLPFEAGGHEAVFGDEAARYFGQVGFEPARRGGEPVKARIAFELTFSPPPSPDTTEPPGVPPTVVVTPDPPAPPEQPIKELDVFEYETVDGGTGVFRRSPKRVESLSGDALQRTGATGLGGITARISGAQGVSSSGTSAGVIVDGLSASYTRVLINGVPVQRASGSASGPQVNLNALGIDLDSVERIDVWRGMGPTSAMGSDGVVINIITSDVADTLSLSARASMLTEFEILQHQSYDLGIEGSVSEDWRLLARGGYQRAAATDVNQDAVFDLSENALWHASADAVWTPDVGRLRMRVLTNGSTTSALGAASAPLFDRVETLDARVHVDGRWTLDTVTVPVELEHWTDVGVNTHTFHKIVRSSGFERLKADTRETRASSVLRTTAYLDEHTLSADLGATMWHIARTGETGALDPVTMGEGRVGLTHTWDLLDGLQLTSQGRFDLHSEYGPGWAAEIAASAPLGDAFLVRASGSHVQRDPSPEELFLFFDHSEVGYQIEGNAALRPEELYVARLGVVFRSAFVKAEIEGFYNRIFNAIDTAPLEGSSSAGAARFTYANIGDVQTAGLNTSVELGTLPGGLTVSGRYSYLPLSERMDTHTPLTLRAEHAAFLELHGAWLGGALEAWFDAAFRSEQVVPEGMPRAPGSVLLGLGVAYRIQGWGRVSLDLNNLLDQTNATWGPKPGFNLMTAFSLDLSLKDKE